MPLNRGETACFPFTAGSGGKEGRGRREQAFWVVFVPCPRYVLTAGLGLSQ